MVRKKTYPTNVHAPVPVICLHGKSLFIICFNVSDLDLLGWNFEILLSRRGFCDANILLSCELVVDAAWWDRSFSLLCRFSQLTRRLLLLLSRPLSVFWWEEPSCQHFLLSCRECRSSQIWSALSRLQKDSRNACLWDLLSGWSLQFFLSDSRSAALFSQTFCWAGPDADGILLYYLDTHSCRFPFCSRRSP